MDNLQIFDNEEFGQVRTIVVNNEPMFCLADVCKALELEQVSRVKSRLREDGVISSKVIDSLGREQIATFINEANLYKTIFQSRKESAEKFTDWVTNEVLPSIRKTGAYNLPKTYKDALKQLLIAVEQNERLSGVVSEMTPKAEYFDDLVDRKLNLNFRNTAKELGIKESHFLQWLITKKFVYRDIRTNRLVPYAQYSESGNGYFTIKEYKSSFNNHAGVQTLVTPKGREAFNLLLKRENREMG